jgi:AcrR family transcriptional regulator
MGLREQKKEHTRQLLADTARRLFSERGFEEVSVAEIAEAAEVSTATVFNYFPTKEDLVYSRLEAFQEQMLAAIRDRAPGETVIAAFGKFILEPRGLLVATDEESARQLTAVTRMIAASPALMAREQQIMADYTDALAELIAEETGAGPADPRPYVVANALIGVHRSLIAYVRRRVEDGTPDRASLARAVRERGEKALALLAEGLGDYAPRSR